MTEALPIVEGLSVDHLREAPTTGAVKWALVRGHKLYKFREGAWHKFVPEGLTIILFRDQHCKLFLVKRNERSRSNSPCPIPPVPQPVTPSCIVSPDGVSALACATDAGLLDVRAVTGIRVLPTIAASPTTIFEFFTTNGALIAGTSGATTVVLGPNSVTFGDDSQAQGPDSIALGSLALVGPDGIGSGAFGIGDTPDPVGNGRLRVDAQGAFAFGRSNVIEVFPGTNPSSPDYSAVFGQLGWANMFASIVQGSGAVSIGGAVLAGHQRISVPLQGLPLAGSSILGLIDTGGPVVFPVPLSVNGAAVNVSATIKATIIGTVATAGAVPRITLEFYVDRIGGAYAFQTPDGTNIPALIQSPSTPTGFVYQLTTIPVAPPGFVVMPALPVVSPTGGFTLDINPAAFNPAQPAQNFLAFFDIEMVVWT